MPPLLACLCHPYRAVRHLASRCLAVLATLDTVTVMSAIIGKILPSLGAADNVTRRQGAAEALTCITDRLQFDIVPYIVLLIVPLLGKPVHNCHHICYNLYFHILYCHNYML